MPGGYGGTDLYKVEMNGDEWGEPQNLGEKINTEGNEMFPFISYQGYLYFSSDGHAGLGGLDIFVSENNPFGFKEPNNIGFPINSPQDDFSIFYDQGAEAGYFSTNRTGTDNIYRFDVVNFVQQIIAMGFENEHGADLAGQNVTLRWLEAQTDSTITLDETGSFMFLADKGSNFEVYLGNKATESSEPIAVFSTDEILRDTFANLGKVSVSKEAIKKAQDLEKVAQLIAASVERDSLGMELAGEDIRQMLLHLRDETSFLSNSEFDDLTSSDLIDGSELNRVVASQTEATKEKNRTLKAYELNNIYFGFDSYAIVPKEQTKVGELKKILAEDPGVSVVIKAHTDLRGNDDYNLLLSMRRAQSIQKYLQKQGIDASRFKIAWVGEKEPLVNCSNKDCSEEDHAQNRRAEVVFVNGDTANKEE
jgi:outer membrane protein OmpA-like peptidoglycan-associated protein